ncbi:MAG: DEAD/DEAH box helicase, partial [Halobacteriovoraceae bacterium]|nr:DEAD/DEAH box helicase [Halobacteriovoraceae bacterium]
TTHILNLIAHEQRIIFVSPLRALAEEVLQRAPIKEKGYLNARCEFENWKFIVCTPESLLVSTLELKRTDLIVLDEIHLFYLWGDSFREKLIEIRELIFTSCERMIALTATISDEVFEIYQQEVALNFEHNYLMDLGNHKLNNPPFMHLTLPKFLMTDDLLKILIEFSLTKGRVLVFSNLRKRVDFWQANFQHFQVLTCKGGEVPTFVEELKKISPDLILSTIALSHGVNLPSVGCVVFDGDFKDESFLVQMLARAGRRGESFFAISHSGSAVRKLLRSSAFPKVTPYLLLIKILLWKCNLWCCPKLPMENDT